MTPIVRIRGLGKYFGPPVVVDGESQPRRAFRALLRIAGFHVKAADLDTQVTVAGAGHVLRDIDLDVAAGSVVCLTGPSGSGKTVLLEILAGSLRPTAGRVEIFAPVTTLLSIGGNLDHRLTARQNIAARRKAAGDSPDEIDRFTAEAIAFAGLEGFEDAALRTFSTGMVLRLSVALALCGRPSLVLIDDVLEVGDIAFRQRCLDRVYELKDAGCTLIAVFSDENVVRQLATRVVTLGGGHIVSDTTPLRWAERQVSGTAALEWHVQQMLSEDDVVALREVTIQKGSDTDEACLDVTARFEAKTGDVRCRPFLVLAGPRAILFRSVYPEFVEVAVQSEPVFTVRVPTKMLPPGEYTISISVVSLHAGMMYFMKASDGSTLIVRRPLELQDADEAEPQPALLVDVPWEVERLAEVPA